MLDSRLICALLFWFITSICTAYWLSFLANITWTQFKKKYVYRKTANKHVSLNLKCKHQLSRCSQQRARQPGTLSHHLPLANAQQVSLQQGMFKNFTNCTYASCYYTIKGKRPSITDSRNSDLWNKHGKINSLGDLSRQFWCFFSFLSPVVCKTRQTKWPLRF